MLTLLPGINKHENVIGCNADHKEDSDNMEESEVRDFQQTSCDDARGRKT